MSAPGNAGPRPCSAEESVKRATKWIGRGTYGLGKGGYDPAHPDTPWTNVNGIEMCDCSSYAMKYAYKLAGHRPGFNHGPWATVSDDINVDSAIEDGEHHGELFVAVQYPQVGDVVCFPSVRGPDGKQRLRIGHTGILVGVPAEWDPARPDYGLLDVVQCQAGKKPAVQRTTGLAWQNREMFKGAIKQEWRSRILRLVP